MFLFTDMESHLNLPSATGPDAPIAYDAVNNSAQFYYIILVRMITAAIVAMKERGGSSKQSIAKYIEREYKNLSLSHATLLNRKLRFCYDKEEAWSSSQDPVQWRWGGGVASPAVGSVCGPMVITAPFDQIGAVSTMMPVGEVDGGTSFKRRTGRSHKLHVAVVEAESIVVVHSGAGAEAVFVCRRSGKLPKVNTGMVGLGEGWYGVCFVCNSSGVDRGYGRPPKMKEMGWFWDRDKAAVQDRNFF